MHRHPPRPPSASLLEAVNILAAYELSGQRPWLAYMKRAALIRDSTRPSAATDVLFATPPKSGQINHPHDPDRRPEEPRVFLGVIGSANKLVRNPELRDRMRDKFKVRAFEMEVSGVADASWGGGVSYLAIRGICDYSDSSKNDTWQNYAAVAAATYMRALIESLPAPRTSSQTIAKGGTPLSETSFQEAETSEEALPESDGSWRGAIRASEGKVLDENWHTEIAALRRRTEHIHVVGCNLYLPQREALRLLVSSRRGSFEARYLLEQDEKVLLVSGVAGSGKSYLCGVMASYVAEQRRVLHGPLSDVARRMSRGESFLSALSGATCEGRYDEMRFVRLLNGTEALLLDGLDETGLHRAALVDELVQWPQRFPNMRLVVTDRVGSETTALHSEFQVFTILPPEEGDIGDFVERVASAMSRQKNVSKLARDRVCGALSARPELRTPLLLGFLTALALAGDDDLAEIPALLYDRVLTLIGRSDRVNRRYTMTMVQRDADAVLDEIAWALHVDRKADLSALMTRISNGLAERQIGGADSRALADQGISFWEERGLLKCILRPARDELELVHATFKDFAAGRRLSRGNAAEISSFAAAASTPEDMSILSVVSSRGSSATIVDAMLTVEPSIPERILDCARVVMHSEIPRQAQARLVESLVALIEHTDIPTYAADAGESLAALVEASRVDAADVYQAVGDHRTLAEEARRLAVLRVRVACVGKGSGGKVSAWIAEQAKQGDASEFDFRNRSFSARRYLGKFMFSAICVVAQKECEQVAADLVEGLIAEHRISLGVRLELMGWAHREGHLNILEAVQRFDPKWKVSRADFRSSQKSRIEGEKGFLAALDLACGSSVVKSSDGSALALLESCSGLGEVVAVDFEATFSRFELRRPLAVLWEAWLKALDIEPGRLRHDITEARHRLEGSASLGSVFAHLPKTPVREPVWSRVDFSQPELAPKALLAWVCQPGRTVTTLVTPMLFGHPQRTAVVDALLEELGAPNPYLLLWLSLIGDELDDTRLIASISRILSGPWPRNAHHLLRLLNSDALRNSKVQARVVEALQSDDVSVVEAAVAATSQIDPTSHLAIEAAGAAFARWTERQNAESEKFVEPEQGDFAIRVVSPTPRGALASLMILGSDRQARARGLLDDEDDGVRGVALACIRSGANCVADLDVIVQSAHAAELIRSLKYHGPFRDCEVEWMRSTVLRSDIAEEIRLELIDVFAETRPEAISEEVAQTTLRGLCRDGLVSIRDRGLNALRSRAKR